MANRIFFDLNIIIDVLDKDRPRFQNSKAALQKAIEDEFEIAMSADMLSNFYYICQKKFDCQDMTKMLLFLMENFVILEFSQDVIESAIKRYEELCTEGKEGDFEDLLQISCAIAGGCSLLVSEDKKIKGLELGTKILSCDEFLGNV